MKILKDGDPEIIKQHSKQLTCTRCGCEFVATEKELEPTYSEDALVSAFIAALDPTKASKIVLQATCPECGQDVPAIKEEKTES